MRLEIEGETRTLGGTGYADQHHLLLVFGSCEQRVAVVDGAADNVEHPRPAGSAEALLTGIGRIDIRPLQRREQRLVGGHEDLLTGRRDGDGELLAVDDGWC